MTATDTIFTQPPELVKSSLLNRFEPLVLGFIEAARPETSQRDIEIAFVRQMFGFMCLVFAVMLGVRARRAAERDIQARGLDPSQVRWRFEKNCWHRVTTTFGRLAFPVWAYRERSANTTKTRTPAAALDPLHAHCHSSIFLLEREVRLGSDHSFRVAQQLMLFYSNDAVDIEDTTIAAHTYAVGRMVKRHYLYRSREDTMEVLRTRATIDRETGRPILYVSTDGHILRRFIDETTLGAWKNANGLRLWCVDRYTGEIIHIGGEYTWGNCEVVEKIVKELISEGLLPADGDYGDGLVARIAWVTDGAPWFETRVFPLFPNAVLILDPYHAIDHIAKYAVEAFGLNTPKKRAFMRQVREAVLGATGAPKGKPGKRKGRRKRSEQEKAEERQQQPSRARLVTKDAGPILALLRKVATPGRCKETLNSLVGYITRNAYRMDYAR